MSNAISAVTYLTTDNLTTTPYLSQTRVQRYLKNTVQSKDTGATPSGLVINFKFGFVFSASSEITFYIWMINPGSATNRIVKACETSTCSTLTSDFQQVNGEVQSYDANQIKVEKVVLKRNSSNGMMSVTINDSANTFIRPYSSSSLDFYLNFVFETTKNMRISQINVYLRKLIIF